MTPQPSSLRQATGYGQMFAQMSRPQNTLYPIALIIIIGGLSDGHWWQIAAATVSISAMYSLATLLNNIVDREVDISNARSDNPLTHTRIPGRALRIFAGLQAGSILLLQFLMQQPVSLILCLSYLACCVVYSAPRIHLQTRGFTATLNLALCYGFVPVLLAAAQGGAIGWDTVLVGLCQILLISPILLAKDYKDERGDRLHGKRTPLVRYGQRGVMIATAVCFVGFAALFVAFPKQLPATTAVVFLGSTYAVMALVLHRHRGKSSWAYGHLVRLTLIVLSSMIFWNTL